MPRARPFLQVVQGSAPPPAKRELYDTVAYSGVVPYLFTRLMSAPCASNDRAASTWPFRQALYSGVRPCSSASGGSPSAILSPAATAMLDRSFPRSLRGCPSRGGAKGSNSQAERISISRQPRTQRIRPGPVVCVDEGLLTGRRRSKNGRAHFGSVVI